MHATHQSDKQQAMKDGPNPGLLRPPTIFLSAILLGIALKRVWPLHFVSPSVWLLGPLSLLAPWCSSCFPTGNFAELALRYREASVPLRSCERVPTASVAIPSIWLLSCLYSDCPFG